MVAGPRFAIYFVPAAASALYRFGAAVLGYDCYTGEALARPREIGLTEAAWAALTAEPRSYGFHATLKAPFRLRDEFDHHDLIAELQTLALATTTIPMLEAAVALIGGFVAVVPTMASPALDKLAADAVMAFERFRAPMSAQERSRRLAAGLSPRQTANLDRFGYPYVFEEFRFHMTLTERIGPDRRDAIHALLRDAFAQACRSGAIRVDRLALMRQDRAGAPFRVMAHARVRNSAG